MKKERKNRGVSIYWLLLMAASGAVAGYMMMATAQQNRAWLQAAATVQHQVEVLDRLHKESQVLSARLSALEDPTRLIYMAGYMHLDRHWRTNSPGKRGPGQGLAGYGVPKLPGKKAGTYAMRNAQ